ncbi:peptide chain release factor N(5)-glutamine methyltransferase [Colwellia maritima]|uniref:peptide chain release factor N(5)-glutamine methyltransferase n=1 Tax=Colwellia maritima TaxID=2912588 RepID=UPI003B848F83
MVSKTLDLQIRRLSLIGDNSIANLITHGQKLLQIGSDSAKLDTEILLSFVLDKDRSFLLTWPEKKLNDTQLHDFFQLLIRRIQGEPIAYIVGVKEFWSLPLWVSKATLIPRPDTETLVESVLEHYSGRKNINCLDLGTGTGAIALALASENPTWKIDAVDFSMDAVELAQRNAKKCQLAHVNIFQSDWFSQIENNKQYDLIVSNPPYIDGNDKNLTEGDVRFEPASALIATDNGLADIKHIANIARNFLTAHGQLFFEHGFEQGDDVRSILENLGFLAPQTKQDLNGHDRITWATFS